MIINEKNILSLAKDGEIGILKSDLVDKVIDKYGSTPLHILAGKREIAVLNHVSVDKVIDNWGRTPLHILASNGEHLLADCGEIAVRDLIKQKYPWFDFPEGPIAEETITSMINTPKSIQFVKSLGEYKTTRE